MRRDQLNIFFDQSRTDNPVADYRLSETDLHIWRLSLDDFAFYRDEFSKMLTRDELDRMNRFVVDAAKGRFIAGRGVLRVILSQYLETDPRQIVFDYHPGGKPRLPQSGQSGVRFNMAHSDRRVVIAVGRDREVGVDIERIRAIDDLEAVASSCFSPGEWATLRELPVEERLTAFFQLWTRKEALLKGRGEPLARATAAGQGSEVTTSASKDSLDGWTVQNIDAGEHHAGAVAAERDGWTVRYIHIQVP